MKMTRLYHYVGPHEIAGKVTGAPPGRRIASPADLERWIRETKQEPEASGAITVTFVVDSRGDLLIADRHSEHVACASGGPVLSAGEMSFVWTEEGFEVSEVTNQATGFCPEPDS